MTLSRHLSYANVASTLAVVLALGGGGAAVAAGVAKNSVGSKQIKAGAVKTVDLAPGAVDGSRIADDSVTGADVAESSLAKVPSAGSADTAASATRASTADKASNLLFAVVEPDGALATASGAAIASTRISAGSYSVSFGRDVSQCASVAAASKLGSGIPSRRFVRSAGRAGEPDAIFVETADSAQAVADGGFALYVLC